MTTLIPYSEPPIPRIALEIERLRQRLDAAEAELKAREGTPAAPALLHGTPLRGKLLPGIAGVATLALVVIAGSLVWQQVHPVPPAQPTIVVQAAPSAGQGALQAQTQAQAPGQMGQPTYQASAAPPSYRPPISLPPPGRPPSRW